MSIFQCSGVSPGRTLSHEALTRPPHRGHLAGLKAPAPEPSLMLHDVSTAGQNLGSGGSGGVGGSGGSGGWSRGSWGSALPELVLLA